MSAGRKQTAVVEPESSVLSVSYASRVPPVSSVPAFRRALLAWYDREARALPWREANLPTYRVWLSEVMLQQTRAASAEARFERFLQRWPLLEDLAAAEQDEVLVEWAGFGYYARARNLHRTARILVGERGGVWPRTEEGLKALPGIGDYTAAAVAAIAFGVESLPVDGNVRRVGARLLAFEDVPAPASPAGKELARALQPLSRGKRTGDFANAMMELGACVCLPRRPKCAQCPVRKFCTAHARGQAEAFPRTRRKRVPVAHRAHAFVVRRGGEVLLLRRPPHGLLGGMSLPPLACVPGEAFALAPKPAPRAVVARLRQVPPRPVRHSFTHFSLTLEVRALEWPADLALPREWAAAGEWISRARLKTTPLPRLGQKILAAAT